MLVVVALAEPEQLTVESVPKQLAVPFSFVVEYPGTKYVYTVS
jgi:hypothetical protein